MVNQDQLKALQERIVKIGEYLKISEKRLQLREEELKTHDPEFWNSNGELRGFKRDLYEGGIRVPCIMRWPGKIAAGSRNDEIVGIIDMLPTFCEIAGVIPVQ